jgi:hypothetical protein
MTNFRFYDHTLNPELVDFWREHARPGRIGLIHIDFAPAKLINWAERWATLSGKPSRWAHTFMFLPSADGVPIFAESDARVPLPGFDSNKPDGPQINPVYKWSHRAVDEAAVVDPRLDPDQLQRIAERVEELIQAGYHYPRVALADTMFALAKGDLSYNGPLAADDTMHCSQLVQECLLAAGASPFPENVHPKNIVPEHFAQEFPVIAQWKCREVSASEETKMEGLRRAYSLPWRRSVNHTGRRGTFGDTIAP